MLRSEDIPAPKPDKSPMGQAIYAFHHSRTGVIQALKNAIAVHQQAQEELLASNWPSNLDLRYADSEAGENTCLVITGFKNADEIESFIRNKLYAQGK